MAWERAKKACIIVAFLSVVRAKFKALLPTPPVSSYPLIIMNHYESL